MSLVKKSINEDVGSIGLEGRLDEFLASTDGSIEYSRLGRLNSPAENITLPSDGASVQLTLDTRIQASMEQAMSQVELEFSPEKMTLLPLMQKQVKSWQCRIDQVLIQINTDKLKTI